MRRVVLVGAGIGGLVAAAALARAGLDVDVLEAHVYPGGCAGTFYHQGYRFDAGATLACGFYPGGPMALAARAAGIDGWPGRASEPAMVVHLPDRPPIERRAGDDRWAAIREVFGRPGERFWRWQEAAADALWDLALRSPAWPPQSARDALGLAAVGLGWLAADPAGRLRPALAIDALRPVAARLSGAPDALRQFVDAQLLISAQTDSREANALYAAAALDLPRRGVVHLPGGIGSIAAMLAEAVRRHGGRVHYRQQATLLVPGRGGGFAVETNKGASFAGDAVILNLTPWSAARLFDNPAAMPPRLRRLPPVPDAGWGAFMLYVGLDAGAVPANFPLHHQVVVREPMGEGNTVFLSLSPGWDGSRAPSGRRAATISSHTRLAPWWRAFEADRAAYQARVVDYRRRVLDAAEVALPGLRDAAALMLTGTPVTFQRFTRRVWGWVGGFPQTSLVRAWAPRLAPGLWLVGDSIFPGQSVAAAALGGLRVAAGVLAG